MKILGCDYDGTLTEGGIGEEKIAAINKWRTAGNLFGIVSGRNRNFRETLLNDFPKLEFDFFAACNGGCITDRNGKIIYEKCCDLSVLPIVKDLFDWGCKFILVQGKHYTCIVENIDDAPWFISKTQACLMEQLPIINYFNQISVALHSIETTSIVVEKIHKKYKKWLHPLQNGCCIDIVPIGVNKAQGLYRVMELFACTHEDVIAVGDNINDKDMIKEFRSYAMANGVEEIKKLANGVIKDVSELIEIELLKDLV